MIVMHILDWTLLPLILAASVYFIIRKFRSTARGEKTCECSGCGAAGSCPEGTTVNGRN